MRSAWFGLLTAVAAGVIGTLAVTGFLLLVRYDVYAVPAGSAQSGLDAWAHVLVDGDAAVTVGDVVVFRGTAAGPGDHVARVAATSTEGLTLDSTGPKDAPLAPRDVVGVVSRSGSLLDLVGFLLLEGARLALPVAAALGLLIALVLGVRRPARPVEASAEEPAEEPAQEAVVEEAPVATVEEAPVSEEPVEEEPVEVAADIQQVDDAGLELVLSGAPEE
jgi:hypothetical protein